MANNNKKANKAKINYYVDLIIGISFIVAAVSGILLLFAGSGGYQGGRNPRFAQEILGASRFLWKDLHNWAGIVMLGGIFLHLVLHWKWMVCMTRNLLKARRGSRAGAGLAGPGVASRARPSADRCPVEG